MSHNQPRMLRQDSRCLGNAPCAAAYYTMEAILKKDALHPNPVESEPSYNDTLEMISDYILDNKHKLIDTLDKIRYDDISSY